MFSKKIIVVYFLFSQHYSKTSKKEKASYFIGEIPNQEDPGPEFSNELIWPPFNPLGAYKGFLIFLFFSLFSSLFPSLFSLTSHLKKKGKLKDGIPHGEGELMCFNGNKYIGDWKLGRRDGQGKMFWSCGNIFTGQFKVCFVVVFFCCCCFFFYFSLSLFSHFLFLSSLG